MASSQSVTVHWRLAWYARLVLNSATAVARVGLPIVPRRFVRWLCMNHWQMRLGESGQWQRMRLDEKGRPR
jgi:hypothetical protein